MSTLEDIHMFPLVHAALMGFVGEPAAIAHPLPRHLTAVKLGDLQDAQVLVVMMDATGMMVVMGLPDPQDPGVHMVRMVAMDGMDVKDLPDALVIMDIPDAQDTMDIPDQRAPREVLVSQGAMVHPDPLEHRGPVELDPPDTL